MKLFDLDKIKDQRIIIVGDVMLDAYIFGHVHRLSPEAPVPIVEQRSQEYRLGGAANVALNIKAMGATPLLFGVTGSDDDALILKKELEKNQISALLLVEELDRLTTVKTRIIGNNHQLLRVDKEVTHAITEHTESLLLEKLKSEIKTADALIFEDYEKGLLNKNLIQHIISLCNEFNVPVIVDPKKSNFLAYSNATLFKPNLKELKEGLKLDKLDSLEEIERAAKTLIQTLNLKYLMVTLSHRGVIICDAQSTHHVPAHLRKIADVSGAGDTVVSIAALAIAQHLEPRAIAELSNLAGGLVCEEVGVVPLNKNRFMDEANKLI
ncbi:MAG: bifunctional ADP-heptose synthase [Bacteroidetes bacterium]|nr:bifunctional ADP-heptose synthase [Bacteroidota bacterium]